MNPLTKKKIPKGKFSSSQWNPTENSNAGILNPLYENQSKTRYLDSVPDQNKSKVNQRLRSGFSA